MKEGLLNELRKIIDEENTFYNQRASRPGDRTSGSSHKSAYSGHPSDQKATVGETGLRSEEGEMLSWKQQVIDDVRKSVISENEKLKSEFGVFFQEIVKQIKIMGSSRKDEREEISSMQLDTEKLMRIIMNLGGRFEKLENRFFSYEVEISTIKEDVTNRLTMDDKKSHSSYDKSVVPFQDEKRIERLTEEIQSISSRQLNLDRHVTVLDKALERLDVKAKEHMDQAKDGLFTYVSESMSEIEVKISQLVHTALTEHASQSASNEEMVREIVANELKKHSRNTLSPQQAPPQSFINKNSPQDKSQGLSEELKSFIEDLVSDKNRQIEDNLEDVKREFAMALNDAEDTSFQMNKKMLESIVANVDALENQVENLKKDISVKSSIQQPAVDIENQWHSISKQIDCLRSSHDDLKDRVSRQITEIEEKVKIDGHSLQSIAKSLSVKADVSMVDQVKSTFDSKLASLDDKIADRQKMEGGGKLSYFLSPFEENAMSGRSYPHPQKFDKKKIPTINLNSIVVSDRLDQPRSRDLPPSKPDDSYTSFEEEFRFRLGKNKMGGKDEGNGVKLEDIKLSYVFSSNSKEGRDNLNLESEPLSRRLFDEEFKYSDRELINIKPMEQERLQMMKMPKEFTKENYKEVERDYSIKKQGPKTQGNSAQITKRSDLPVANEEYSVILNNISNLSANSQAFMRQVVRQSGKKASSSKNQVAIAVEDQSENKENTNTSNSIRVIQDDAFDFEKWAKDNDLHISGFQL